MKLKNIILVSLLLIILSIGVVSASEDVNLTSATNDDIVVSDEPIKEDVNITVGADEVILKGTDNYFLVDIPVEKLPDGKLKATINGKEVYNQPAYRGTNEVPYSILTKNLGNSFGEYDIVFTFTEDSIYNDASNSFKFKYDYYNFNIPNVTSDSDFGIYFASDASGTVTLTIDNKKIDTQTVEDGSVYFDFYGLKYGKHDYEVQFKSTKNTNAYKSFTKTGSFNYEYLFNVWPNAEELYYGETTTVEGYLPWDATKNVTISYNGKTKSKKLDDEGAFIFDIDDLILGKNTITVSYPKDSQYSANSKTVTINVKEKLNVTTEVGYLSGNGVYLKMPENSTGKLNVIVDGVEKTYDLENGIVNVDLSNYAMGSHSVKVNYTGDDYQIKGYEGNFNVVANFIYPKAFYYKDALIISMALPSDANGTFIVSSDGKYRKSEVINGNAQVSFENLPADEGMEFSIEYVDGNYDSYKKLVKINGREDAPDGDLYINLPETILLDSDYNVRISLGVYSEGNANVTIDGKFCGNHEVYENVIYLTFYDLIKDLKAGNHTIKIDYSGDDYFTPKSNSTTFNLDYFRISDPEVILVGEDSYSIQVSPEITGTATLYIAGKTIKGSFERYYDEDDEGYFYFDVSKIPFGDYQAKLVFSGDKKYAGFTKLINVTVTQWITLDVDDVNYYGNVTGLHFATGAKIKTANITVGDKTYTRTFEDGEIYLEVENLALGEQTVYLTTVATSTYPQKTFNWTYNVIPKINVPERINIFDGGNITLTLPQDANGNLSVSVYDKGDLIQTLTQKVENGNASIFINISKLGPFEIVAKYDGDDYQVNDIDAKITVMPKITYSPEKIYVGQDADIIFEMPSDANGKLTLGIGEQRLNVTYKDGKAVVPIPHLKPYDDVYYLYVLYEDPVYGTYYDEMNHYIDVLKYDANIKVTLPKEIIANNYITITLTLPSDATGYVSTDYGSAKLKNGKATLKVFIPNSGKNSIYYYYSGDDKYKESDNWMDITALPAPKLTMSAVTVYYTKTATMKVKVVDSYGKIVVGKSVAFYVNGVKVKSVKTDKKGYATIKLSKAPGTYNVKATYKGGVVTKKLTVKHILTLKTVKVKKSAKKLVLKVTLKKGKKALKWKKITIKFNGKKYTRYTNGKGIAKLTIYKKTLKKLKVGKSVTYQAKYLNDVVKKSAKVTK